MRCPRWPALPLLPLLGCDDDKPTTPTSVVVPISQPPATTPSATNRAPTARIADYQPRTTAVAGGTHVSFGAAGSDPDGDRLTFNWDFGDGTTGSGEALFPVFYGNGDFEVKLTATDGRGGTATYAVRVTARRVEGEWLVDNANRVHLTARISLRYSASTDLCIPTGSYSGNVVTSVDTIVFDGPGCEGFTLRRR